MISQVISVDMEDDLLRHATWCCYLLRSDLFQQVKQLTEKAFEG